MNVSNVSSSSFQAYEGIRILVPGAVMVTLYGAVVSTFDLAAPSPASNAFAAAVAALLAGLFLRFIDLPARSAAYRSRDLPDRELRRWDIDPRPYGGHTNVFFVMLDASFPPTIRDRGLYMGSIFRIGFESIYAVGFTSLAVLVAATTFRDLGPSRGATSATCWLLYVFAGGHCVALAGAVAGLYMYRRRRHSRGAALRELADDVRADPLAVAVGSIVMGMLALLVFIATHNTLLGIAAPAAPMATWAVLYVRGRGRDSPIEPRDPISAPTAVGLYGAASIIALVEAAVWMNTQSPLNTRTAFAWGVASLIPAVVMANRGAERSLIGSYRTQTTWLRFNRDTLIKEYGLHRAGTSAHSRRETHDTGQSRDTPTD
jgi:hypothetical protein